MTEITRVPEIKQNISIVNGSKHLNGGPKFVVVIIMPRNCFFKRDPTSEDHQNTASNGAGFFINLGAYSAGTVCVYQESQSGQINSILSET